MDKKLFKYAFKSPMVIVILLIGAAVGLLPAWAISVVEGSDDSVHSVVTVLCGFAAVVAAILKTTDLFSVSTAFNRSRRSLLTTLTVLFLIYSAFAAVLSMAGEFLASKLFSFDDFTYEFRPMLQNMGISHESCTGFPGILLSFAFQLAFFLMLFMCGLFVFGLFRRLPAKLGLSLWLIFIFGLNMVNILDIRLSFLNTDMNASLRIGLIACLLVFFAAVGTYCIRTCSAEPRRASNA